jgi:hypothetical protein
MRMPMIKINFGECFETLEVPDYVQHIYEVITCQNKSDPEKLISILEAIQGREIWVKKCMLNQIRDAEIRTKYNELLGQIPPLNLECIKRQLSKEFNLKRRQLHSIVNKKGAE